MSLRPVTVTEAFYKALQVGLKEFGDFLREVAVLLLVFIPVDYYKGNVTPMQYAGVFVASGAIFIIGLVFEFAAIAVKRKRDLYEEEKGQWIRVISSE